MVHGNVCRALFKVTNGIAACGHHIAQELISLCDCTSGAVNEPPLNPAPRLYEARAITLGKRSNVQTLHSFGALFESGFRMSPASVFLHRAVIFGSKLSAQSFGSTLSKGKPRDNASNHNHSESNDQG
jgi:hypothetical protein